MLRRSVVGGVLAGVALGLVAVAPAGAATVAAASAPTTWLYLIGIPLLVVIAIVLISAAPSWTQSGRYNPAAGWFYEPLWLGSAPHSENALDSVATGSQHDVVPDPGGVSASW